MNAPLRSALRPVALFVAAGLACGQETIFTLPGDYIGTQLGFSVDFIGDIDGDDVDDWIAGAPGMSENGNSSGVARVYSGLSGDVLYQYEGLTQFYRLGRRVAAAGDVNKDGTPDFMFASNVMNSAPGRVDVRSGVDGSSLYSLTGGPFALFGRGLAGAEDIDGDDYDDFIVGAPGQSTATGRIIAYSGRTGSVHWEVVGTGTLWAGFDLDFVGDLDGDGFSDVIAGGYLFNQSEGLVKVLSGHTGAEIYSLSGSPTEQIGRAVAGLGDVNGDDVPDFAVSATSDYVRVYSGADLSILHQWNSAGAFNNYGFDVANAGDVDLDGVADVALSQTEANVAIKVRVFSGATGDELLTIDGDSGFGYSLAGGGDVNGDGLTDLLIGDPLDDAIALDTGFVYAVTPGCPAGADETFCTTAPNSVGSGALMDFQNSLSVAANNLRLLATGCPENQFGVFFYGKDATEVPFGDGFRCVDPPLFRLPVVSTGGGTASFLVDFTDPPQASGEITGFSSWLFQFWYRDPQGAGRGLQPDGRAAAFVLPVAAAQREPAAGRFRTRLRFPTHFATVSRSVASCTGFEM